VRQLRGDITFICRGLRRDRLMAAAPTPPRGSRKISANLQNAGRGTAQQAATDGAGGFFRALPGLFLRGIVTAGVERAIGRRAIMPWWRDPRLL